jgi:hypothetical protein
MCSRFGRATNDQPVCSYVDVINSDLDLVDVMNSNPDLVDVMNSNLDLVEVINSNHEEQPGSR